jgi:hypothetical protein
MIFCDTSFLRFTVDNGKLMETCMIPLARCVQSEINMKFIIIIFSPFEICGMCNIPCFGIVEELFFFRRPILFRPFGSHLTFWHRNFTFKF